MAWGRLALIQGAKDEQAIAILADVFGYIKKYEYKPNEHLDPLDKGGSVFENPENTITETNQTIPKRPSAKFLRINKIIKTETQRDDLATPTALLDTPISLDLDAQTGTYLFAKPTPLITMARLLPLIFNGLTKTKNGHCIDPKRLVKCLAQGKPIQRLPKRQKQRWPQRLQIIVDASLGLEPHWADFEYIVRQLQALLDQEAVQVLCFDADTLGTQECYCSHWPPKAHDQWRLWQAPLPDVAILILSDLGVGDNRIAVAWQRQLACLQNHPSPVLTLSPALCSPDDTLFCRQFKPTPLQDYHALPRHPSRSGFTLTQPSPEMIETILTWLSPLPVVDAGLLRRLRLALQWGDSSLETLVWNHHAVRYIDFGIRVQQSKREHYQQLFQQDYAGTEAAKTFWREVNRHHQQAYAGLRQLEKLSECLFEHQDDTAMRHYYRWMCASGWQSNSGSAQKRAWQLQCRTLLASLPPSLWSSGFSEMAYHAYAVANEDKIRAGQWPEQLPAGFNPDRLQWLVPDTAQELQQWQIIQTGDQGQLKFALRDNDRVTRPIYQITAAKNFPPRLTLLKSGQSVTQPLAPDDTLTLAENEIAIVESSHSLKAIKEKITLEAVTCPNWAHGITQTATGLQATVRFAGQEMTVFWQTADDMSVAGRWVQPSSTALAINAQPSNGFVKFDTDAFGFYANLTVFNITQRFRWIEPGSFWMGSPEIELEREWAGIMEGKGNETLHQVSLTQGFWLADTAVTQAFWQAVT